MRADGDKVLETPFKDGRPFYFLMLVKTFPSVIIFGWILNGKLKHKVQVVFTVHIDHSVLGTCSPGAKILRTQGDKSDSKHLNSPSVHISTI